MKRKKKETTGLQLKISLMDSKPMIWRRIVVPHMYTFFDLHVAIQDVFEWQDAHLHQFFIDNPEIHTETKIRIAFPMPDDDMYDLFEVVKMDEREVSLIQYLKKPKDAVYYEYDFGDSWMHKVQLEKVVSNVEGECPKLVVGAQAEPREDCGGISGYYHLLNVLRNPDHKEHDELCDWLGIDEPEVYLEREFDTDIPFRDPKKVLRYYEQQLGLDK